MRIALSTILLFSVFCTQSALALMYTWQFTGEITTKQLFNPLGSVDDIDIGDKVEASFNFDNEEAQFRSSSSLLGGITANYSIILHDYKFTIGDYNFDQNQLNASLYLHDNVGGNDSFGFSYNSQSIVNMPFNGNLMGTQFQARANNQMIDNININNGLPFDYPDWTIFSTFRSGESNYYFRGPLSVSATPVPEPSTYILFGLGFAGLWLGKNIRGVLRKKS